MSFTFIIIMIILAAFLVNLLFTRWYIQFAERKEIYDIPIARSSHTKKTPRGGGAGFVMVSVAVLLGLLVFYSVSEPVINNVIYLITALSGISLLGWFDDMGNLLKRVRFTVQIICALTVLLGIGSMVTFYIPLIITVQAGFVGTLLGIVWIAGTTNIYNFMDGVDGIASLQGVVAALSWSAFGWMLGFEMLVIMNLVLVATLFAFLKFNWSPASVFMGDVGSVFLGFWFASMPFLAAAQSSEIMIGDTLWFGAIVVWPFLFDGSFTIVRRYRRGENILDAHRSHLYQRLNIAGYSHKYISSLYTCFAIISSLFAFFFLQGSEFLRFVTVALLFILSLGYAFWVQKVEERKAEVVHN